MVQLLYKLDRIVCKGVADENNMMITLEAFTRIKSYLKDYSSKIQAVKAHMRESLTLLSEVQLDLIDKVIACQREPMNNDVEPKHTCDWCGKEFGNKGGCTTHMRSCKSKPCEEGG